MTKVLITLTDVEPAIRLNAMVEGAGIATAMVSPMDDLPSAVKREKPDVIVVTGNLLDPPTQALVRQQLWDGAAVVGLADVGDRELEHRLRANGFSEVMTKPVATEELFNRVKALLDRREMAARTGLHGESEAVREVLVKIEQMAPVSSTVLIEGESGTGKELVARAIYSHGRRAQQPFLAINCAAIPEQLLESELFGHEKGAFTSADKQRIGRFEQADGGTLFLDEVADMDLSLQAQLLLFLKQRGNADGKAVNGADIRILCASHRDLGAMTAAGTFREDLYYRINVIPIVLPPLVIGLSLLNLGLMTWNDMTQPPAATEAATEPIATAKPKGTATISH
mgnify:CR=1 FL=1